MPRPRTKAGADGGTTLLTVSAGAVLPPDPPACPHARTEEYPETRPDGTPLVIWRCQDCGAHRATPVEEEGSGGGAGE